MDYDTYGSSAVELAIDLANAELDPPGGVETFLTSHAEWFSDGTALALSGRDTAAVARTAQRCPGRPARPSPTAITSKPNPSVIPSMWGMTGRNPKFAAEAVTMTTFGPGVSDMTEENSSNGPSRMPSVMPLTIAGTAGTNPAACHGARVRCP